MEWTFEGNQLPSNAFVINTNTGSSLRIQYIKLHNEGRYSCSYSNELKQLAQEHAFLQVIGKTLCYTFMPLMYYVPVTNRLQTKITP